MIISADEPLSLMPSELPADALGPARLMQRGGDGFAGSPIQDPELRGRLGVAVEPARQEPAGGGHEVGVEGGAAAGGAFRVVDLRLVGGA